MNGARLSPDGHAVAFSSPVGGVWQVFVMLISGGEPLQLTSDSGDKIVNSFSTDGTEIYYHTQPGSNDVWAVHTLGGSPNRLALGFQVTPSPDGRWLYYAKQGGIFRSDKSGLGEERLYYFDAPGLRPRRILPFSAGDHLLVFLANPQSNMQDFRAYDVNSQTRTAVELGEVPANSLDAVWAEPGKAVLLSRSVNGLTNKCTLLLPGVVTFGARFAPDGKSFSYAVQSEGTVTIYRQAWRDGTPVGKPQIVLKLPFAFPLQYEGNAYDFSPDLSTIVYARPGGHADLYLLSQK